MRPSQKQNNRKPLTFPRMALPGAPYLALEMWMLQPSQRESTLAAPQQFLAPALACQPPSTGALRAKILIPNAIKNLKTLA